MHPVHPPSIFMKYNSAGNILIKDRNLYLIDTSHLLRVVSHPLIPSRHALNIQPPTKGSKS